jgi:LmbE family N-acetylglucosaminyl deacetylase
VQKMEIVVDSNKPATFLFLGAHCDDIEIGCGGTVLRFAEQFPNAHFVWVILSSDPTRAEEARQSFAAFLTPVTKKSLRIEQFRNGYFPYLGDQIKDFFEELKQVETPDIIFTHHRNDLHQDHRVVCELTWNTFRKELILEYEIPKYDGDLGSPNLFVHLDEASCQQKVDNVITCFNSQAGKHWFTQDTFYSLLRLRGIESNSPSGYAEGFYCRKVVL